MDNSPCNRKRPGEQETIMNTEQYINPAYIGEQQYYVLGPVTFGTENQQKPSGHQNHESGSPPGARRGTSSAQANESRKEKNRNSILKKISNGIINSLENVFYMLGMTVARHPKKTIVIVVTTCLLLGIGILKYDLNEDLTAMLVPESSRVMEGRHWVRNNIPYMPRIVKYIIVDENVMSKSSVIALFEVWKESYRIRTGNSELSDICDNVNGQCLVSSLLDLWQYNETIIRSLTDADIQEAVNTIKVNPMFYTEFNASTLLRGRTEDSSGRILSAHTTLMTWRMITTSDNAVQVKTFEDRMIELCEKGHNELDNIYIFTVTLYGDTYFEAVYGDLMLLALGFPLILLYMLLSFGKPNMMDSGMFLVLVALAAVPLSASACYGICLAAGLDYNAIYQTLFFLLLAIGVDDAFIIMEAWKRVDADHPHEELEMKLALAMKHAGVSVTVTSVSNFAAFGAGISTLMPILSYFCVYCCVGVLALFVIQTTLFPACLFIEQRRKRNSRNAFCSCVKHANYSPNRFSDIAFVRPFFEKIYGPVLISTPAKIIVTIATFATVGVMAWSLTQSHVGFDLGRNVPENSLPYNYLAAQSKYYHNEGHVFQVYCDSMDYFTNIKKIDIMMQKFENTTAVRSEFTESWVEPFKNWLNMIVTNGETVSLDSDGFPTTRDEFNDLLYRFIKMEPYGAVYKYNVYISNETEFIVNFTIFNMVRRHVFDSRQNEVWLDEIRNIADTSGTTGTCFAHGELFMYVEIIKYVDTELLRNFILAGVAVFIVTLLLIVDLRTSLFVLLCVVFTTVNLGGVLSFADFYMDGNMVVILTFSIGLSVDFSAHVGYMFMTVAGTRDERAKKTLALIGPAVFHGGFCTFLCFLVLVFAKSYILYLFFVTFVTVAAFGLFHGLCFLPVILSLIGPPPYDNALQAVHGTENVGEATYKARQLSNNAVEAAHRTEKAEEAKYSPQSYDNSLESAHLPEKVGRVTYGEWIKKFSEGIPDQSDIKLPVHIMAENVSKAFSSVNNVDVVPRLFNNVDPLSLISMFQCTYM